MLDLPGEGFGSTFNVFWECRVSDKSEGISVQVSLQTRKDTATFRSQRNCVLFFSTLCFPPLFLMYYQSGARASPAPLEAALEVPIWMCLA